MELSGFNQPEDAQLVYIVSLQWFWNKEIDRAGFSAKFSPLRYYSYLLDSVDDKHKQYVSNRILQVVPSSMDLNTLIYAEYSARHLPNILIRLPLALDTAFLSTKDKYNIVKEFKNVHDAPRDDSEKIINWQQEEAKAKEMGQAVITNNEIFVSEEYYDSYLKEDYEQRKDMYQNKDILNSDEYKDYELFLTICAEKGIKPLIVIAPGNGYFYDYSGISKEKRHKQYQLLTDMAEKHGFKVYNMEEHEYTPYVFVSHL
jgi:D-alanine transfer protein